MSTRNETLLNQTRISNCHNEHEAIDKSGWWWSSRGRWCGRGDEVGLLLLVVAMNTVAVMDEGWRRGMAQDLWALEATPVLGR